MKQIIQVLLSYWMCDIQESQSPDVNNDRSPSERRIMHTIDILREKSENFEAALSRAHKKMAQRGGLETTGAAEVVDNVAEALRAGTVHEATGHATEIRQALEAIILEDLRPAYLIEHDQIVIHGNYDRLDLIYANKDILENTSKSVGRVDLFNHATMEYAGTGWLVASDVVVTNRHVANVFSQPRWQGGWNFVAGSFGRPLRVELDFISQKLQQIAPDSSAIVTDTLYVAPPGGPDMAFLRVLPEHGRQPIELFTSPIGNNRPVATVGYPGWDGHRNDSDLMDSLFDGIYDVKRFSPGMINGIDESGVIIFGDYTSLGGNSGSAVLDLETGKAVGLHFAGVFRQTNYAVAADIVAAALLDISAPQVKIVVEVDTPTTEVVYLSDRRGYDPDFLGAGELSVPYPDLGEKIEDLAPVEGSSDNILHYRHFSVMQSKSRRLPLLTAVNIDGSKAFRLKRSGTWRLDGRLRREYQVGNEFYRHNTMDRGNMVRRGDPGWGETKEEAQQAEADTFHYTNCAPQHKQLQQNDWVGLEDYILEAPSTKDFKASVMTGPIYQANDRMFVSQLGAEDIQIPENFWKIAVIINSKTGEMSATGYILTQGEMIRDVTEAAFVLGKYMTYQVKISMIEAATGFDWGPLRDRDPLINQGEAAFGKSVIPVHGPEYLLL